MEKNSTEKRSPQKRSNDLMWVFCGIIFFFLTGLLATFGIETPDAVHSFPISYRGNTFYFQPVIGWPIRILEILSILCGIAFLFGDFLRKILFGKRSEEKKVESPESGNDEDS